MKSDLVTEDESDGEQQKQEAEQQARAFESHVKINGCELEIRGVVFLAFLCAFFLAPT